MELRKSSNTIKKKQLKKKIVKEKTVDYVLANLLPQIFNREAIKQSLDLVHDSKFDMQYQAMMQEKGLPVPDHAFKNIRKLDELRPKTLEQFPNIQIMVPFHNSYYENAQNEKIR